jgi:hypothetical protein
MKSAISWMPSQKTVLITGNVFAALMLPFLFNAHDRAVAAIATSGQAVLSLLMLFGRMAVKRFWDQQQQAAQLAGALRKGLL